MATKIWSPPYCDVFEYMRSNSGATLWYTREDGVWNLGCIGKPSILRHETLVGLVSKINRQQDATIKPEPSTARDVEKIAEDSKKIIKDHVLSWVSEKPAKLLTEGDVRRITREEFTKLWTASLY